MKTINGVLQGRVHPAEIVAWFKQYADLEAAPVQDGSRGIHCIAFRHPKTLDVANLYLFDTAGHRGHQARNGDRTMISAENWPGAAKIVRFMAEFWGGWCHHPLTGDWETVDKKDDLEPLQISPEQKLAIELQKIAAPTGSQLGQELARRILKDKRAAAAISEAAAAIAREAVMEQIPAPALI